MLVVVASVSLQGAVMYSAVQKHIAYSDKVDADGCDCRRNLGCLLGSGFGRGFDSGSRLGIFRGRIDGL